MTACSRPSAAGEGRQEIRRLHGRRVIVCAAAAPSGPAAACGDDGQIDNPFAQAYPGTLSVAVNTRKALQAGHLARVLALAGEVGLKRVAGCLEQLRQRIEGNALPASFSLYRVDSALWVRFDAGSGALQMELHGTPEDGEAVLLASEATLSAILKVRLTETRASQLGLMRWSSPPGRQLLAAHAQ